MITHDWLVGRGFVPNGLGRYDKEVGDELLIVYLKERGVAHKNAFRDIVLDLPVPFTCEAVDTLIALFTPPALSIFDRYRLDRWCVILRKQPSGRWLSLAQDYTANTWAWLSVSNGPTEWVARADLPTTGEISIVTDPAEMVYYTLE